MAVNPGLSLHPNEPLYSAVETHAIHHTSRQHFFADKLSSRPHRHSSKGRKTTWPLKLDAYKLHRLPCLAADLRATPVDVSNRRGANHLHLRLRKGKQYLAFEICSYGLRLLLCLAVGARAALSTHCPRSSAGNRSPAA